MEGIAGSYGMVIPDIFTHKRDVVLKIFFSKKDLDSALQKIKDLPRIMGYNIGHTTKTYEPHKTYAEFKKENPTLAEQYKRTRLEKKGDVVLNNTVLPIVVMQDNGIDISYLNSDHRYTCPVLFLLKQFEKVLKQTAILHSQNMIHHDIRDDNVMINIDKKKHSTESDIIVESPRLTIIDFDQLTEYSEYAKQSIVFYSSYHRPVEGVFFTRGLNKSLTLQIPSTEKDIPLRLHTYVELLYDAYMPVFFIFYDNITEDGLYALIIEKIQQIKSYNVNMTMHTTDNFGLGFCLLQILALFYYNSNYPTTLKEEEQVALDATRDLLKSMVDFDVSARPLPDMAHESMKTICTTLQDSLLSESNPLNEWNALLKGSRSRSYGIERPTANTGSSVPIRSTGAGYHKKKRPRHTRKQRTRQTSKHRTRRASKN